MNEGIIHHYDMLIDMNNDPVHDPAPLRDYMDKWDGLPFLDRLQLDKKKTVLEIGVGTGRLATRVAPFCAQFSGIDLSPKTVQRATENLAQFQNVTLICDDFLTYSFDHQFDVIYSSLTFMHIQDKTCAITKVADLLNPGGRFVLSIDKNPADCIDLGNHKLTVFPDRPEEIVRCLSLAGLRISDRTETEFAHIFTALKA